MSRRVVFLSAGVAVLLLATIAIAKKPENPDGKPGKGPKPSIESVVIIGDVNSGYELGGDRKVVEIGHNPVSWPETRLFFSSTLNDTLLNDLDPPLDPPLVQPSEGSLLGLESWLLRLFCHRTSCHTAMPSFSGRYLLVMPCSQRA